MSLVGSSVGSTIGWSTKYGSKYFTDYQLECAQGLYPDAIQNTKEFGQWVDVLVENHPTLVSHSGSSLVANGGGTMLIYLYGLDRKK